MKGLAFVASNGAEGRKSLDQRCVSGLHLHDHEGSSILSDDIGLAATSVPVGLDDGEPGAQEVPPSGVLAPTTDTFLGVNEEVSSYPRSNGAIERA